MATFFQSKLTDNLQSGDFLAIFLDSNDVIKVEAYRNKQILPSNDGQNCFTLPIEVGIMNADAIIKLISAFIDPIPIKIDNYNPTDNKLPVSPFHYCYFLL